MVDIPKTYDLEELARCNWHVHASFSSDSKARATLGAMVAAAETAGLRTIAVVDHHRRGGDLMRA